MGDWTDSVFCSQVGLVPYVSTVHDRLTVEIRRGCTRGCRFCQPGMLTRPARDVPPEKVVEAVEKGMRETGEYFYLSFFYFRHVWAIRLTRSVLFTWYNEFSLLSLSCSEYLALPSVGLEIKNRLKDENVTLSLPSNGSIDSTIPSRTSSAAPARLGSRSPPRLVPSDFATSSTKDSRTTSYFTACEPRTTAGGET